MPPNRFESEVESFLEGSHGDRTHIKRADHPRLHHYAGHYWANFDTRERQGLAATPMGDDDATAAHISHVIYRGHFSRYPKNVAIPTMQIRSLNE